MLHEVLLILLIAAVEAHDGISAMLCADVEVMERAIAQMANWYRMIERKVWGRQGTGFRNYVYESSRRVIVT